MSRRIRSVPTPLLSIEVLEHMRSRPNRHVVSERGRVLGDESQEGPFGAAGRIRLKTNGHDRRMTWLQAMAKLGEVAG